MADLIDRQALLRDIEKYHLSDGKFQHWVEVQPSVEAEPVRHGHWEIYVISMLDGEDVRCSECGQCGCAPYWDYCPNCGARMDCEQDG